VLVRPFAKAVLLGGAGGALVVLGWPASVAAAALLALGTLVALRAVWRWERTRVLMGEGRLTVVDGTLRRRSASAELGGAVEIEQSFVGRLLGYGTVTVGELEVPYVPVPALQQLQ
jgi:uncharacterized membrane protein YdbT with pleckstrin-like domain